MSKREELRERRRQKEKRTRIAWITAAVVLVLGAAAAFILPPIIAMNGITKAALQPRPQQDGLSMGDPNAPVKVEEFSDFQCPICKDFADTYEPSIIRDFVATGKVYFTYNPMAFIGPESVTAAKAALCASEQNKFWQFKDMLFANHTGENVGDYSDSRLVAFARAAGVYNSAFKKCAADNTYTDLLKIGRAHV